MIPHLDKALLEFEQAVERSPAIQSGEWHIDDALDCIPEWAALKAALAIEARDREEVRVGCELEGFPGMLWRLIAQCDYRRVMVWYKAEIIRGSPQPGIFDCAASAVSTIVLQIAGGVVRHTMRPCAQEIMGRAVKMLEEDIATLMDHKKSDAIIRRGLTLLPGGK